jgi:predicted nucleic acid-binding protein
MAVILLDTSILIDHLRGYPPAVSALSAVAGAGHRLAGSVLTRVEVFAGMRPSEERITRRLLDIMDWVPVDEAIADDAGRLANYFLKSHPTIDPVDYVIAATADRSDAILWTRNLNHFPMFPGLKAPY